MTQSARCGIPTIRGVTQVSPRHLHIERALCGPLRKFGPPWSPSPSPVALQASRYDRSGDRYVELEGWGYFFP